MCADLHHQTELQREKVGEREGKPREVSSVHVVRHLEKIEEKLNATQNKHLGVMIGHR